MICSLNCTCEIFQISNIMIVVFTLLASVKAASQGLDIISVVVFEGHVVPLAMATVGRLKAL